MENYYTWGIIAVLAVTSYFLGRYLSARKRQNEKKAKQAKKNPRIR